MPGTSNLEGSFCSRPIGFCQVRVGIFGILFAFICVMLVSAAGVRAETVTSSDVFQSVQDLIAELDQLRHADLDPPIPDDHRAQLTQRQPRHVLQKVLILRQKIQHLRYINGRDVKEIPPLPVREVTPQDVKAVVEQALAEIRDLRSAYGVTAQATPATLQAGKTPTDVYDALLRAEARVASLGIPITGHYDVLRLIVALTRDVRTVCAAAPGRHCPELDLEPDAKSLPPVKSPSDIYERGFEIYRRLKQIVDSNPALAIPGGVVLPKHLDRTPVPDDVMELLYGVLAEVSSVKAKINAAKSTDFPSRAGGFGKTPQWCFYYLGQALDYEGAVLRTAEK